MSPFYCFSLFLFFCFCFGLSERAIVNSAVFAFQAMVPNRQMLPEMAIAVVFVFSETETSGLIEETNNRLFGILKKPVARL